MSSIHEALKKAQMDRNAGRDDSRPLSLSLERSPRSRKPLILWAGLFFGFLCMGLVWYWWGNAPQTFKTPETPAEEQVDSPHPTPFVTAQPPPAGVAPKEQAAAFHGQGMAHHRAGRLVEAREWYDQALALDPEHGPSLNNLGVLDMMDQNYGAARHRFQESIRLDPGYVDPVYNLACVFALTRQYHEAMERLNQAIAMDPVVREWILEDPDLKDLRSHPGFRELVEP